jgi:hypothetical protein
MVDFFSKKEKEKEKPIDFVTCNVENIHMLVYVKYVAIYMQYMR